MEKTIKSNFTLPNEVVTLRYIHRNRGMAARNDLSGINWCKTPVCLLEMGFISNGDEDRKLNNSDFQQKIAEGIANGIDAYFGR